MQVHREDPGDKENVPKVTVKNVKTPAIAEKKYAHPVGVDNEGLKCRLYVFLDAQWVDRGKGYAKVRHGRNAARCLWWHKQPCTFLHAWGVDFNVWFGGFLVMSSDMTGQK